MGGTVVGRTEAWSVAVTPRPSSEAASKGQLEPGTILADRFEILQLLGQGGMGAVYKGRDMELERLVALKLIRPDLASHPEILRRFKQELILAREVTHRNVIRIFDLGQAQGIKFITMEYVEGRDLRGLIHEKQKFSTDEAVPIVLQIAAALDAAHTAGVVHRDLKPQNVMVDKDGRVYVMDFGIARSLETPGMTQTGALMGTPEYMSPEQAKGEKVDARSDLFALGIIFYEMLTGISPFKADTAMAMMFKRTQERATPLAQMNVGVPPVISDIVSKCAGDQASRALSDRARSHQRSGSLEGRRGRTAPSFPPARASATFPATRNGWRSAPSWLFSAAVSTSSPLVHAAAVQFAGGPVKSVSLAILPFHNASSDPSSTGSAQPRRHPQHRRRPVCHLARFHPSASPDPEDSRSANADLAPTCFARSRSSPNAEFDPDMLRNIATFSNADILVWGRYVKVGDQIRIDGTLQDFKRDQRVPAQDRRRQRKRSSRAPWISSPTWSAIIWPCPRTCSTS